MIVSYLKNAEIDRIKWDGCIDKAVNGITYAYSWYLDEVAESWDALVLDDYLAVMPLTSKRRFGIWYLYQPFFTQQLGPFSTQMLSSDLVGMFLESIPSKFRLIDISLNTFTNSKFIEGFRVEDRITYHLDLIEPYAKLYQKYSKNTQRNLAKAIALQVSVVRGVDLGTFLKFSRDCMQKLVSANALAVMDRLVRKLIHHGRGELYGAYTNTNTLCAAALFVRSKGKSIYLLANSSEEGIAQRAMFLLIDSYIQKNSESIIVLDFEGSMLPGVAKFYQGFGACAVTYPHLYLQSLPWLFLWLFKIRRRLLH